MKVEKHPFDYDFRARFPGAKPVAAGESWGAFEVVIEGKLYRIIDNGFLADVLDEGHPLLNELVTVEIYEPEEIPEYLVGSGLF